MADERARRKLIAFLAKRNAKFRFCRERRSSFIEADRANCMPGGLHVSMADRLAMERALKQQRDARPKSAGLGDLECRFVVRDSVEHRRKVLFTKMDQIRHDMHQTVTPPPLKASFLKVSKKDGGKGRKKGLGGSGLKKGSYLFRMKTKGSKGMNSDNESVCSHNLSDSNDIPDSPALSTTKNDLKRFFSNNSQGANLRGNRKFTISPSKTEAASDLNQIVQMIRLTYEKKQPPKPKPPQFFFKKGPKLPPLPKAPLEKKLIQREYDAYKQKLKVNF